MKTIFPVTFLFLLSLNATADSLKQSISALEARLSARVGIAILDTHNNKSWSYNGDQRFPMMSTFKTLACANLFYRSNVGEINKSAEFEVHQDSLVVWSPVTKNYIGKTISLNKACEATMLTSDNTAANIVLENTGGPKQLTDFLTMIGDKVTRLDRIEPELNQAKVGDIRDTTTPNAMVNTLSLLLLGDVLTETDSKQLKSWMQQNSISEALLRSVLPEDWSIADRTGAGENGSRAITALVWHKNKKPIIIAIYLTESDLTLSQRNKVVAEIGQLIFDTLPLK